MPLACALLLVAACGDNGDDDDQPNGDGAQAVINTDTTAIPNTTITLDGTGSTVSDGSVTYEWRVEERPDGSDADLDDPGAPQPSMLVDVAGEYEVCLRVTNGDESDETCQTIEVVPSEGLHLELVWNHPEDAETDLDLHYASPDADWFSTNDPAECTPNGPTVWWCVPNPDWGGGDGGEPDGDPSNDPSLDVDNLVGDGPENINQPQPFDGEAFRVGVHHYCDYGNGEAEARLRIYFNGELQHEETRNLSMGQFWEAARFDISDDGESIEVEPIDEIEDTDFGVCP